MRALAARVFVHAGVAIEMVLGDVEHRRRDGARDSRSSRAGSSIARARTHRASAPRARTGKSVEHRLADVAGGRRGEARGAHSDAVSAVTVVLPFEPVIARTFWPGGSARANSSMSPTSSTPRATAARIAGWSLAQPGADDDRLGARERRVVDRPGRQRDLRQFGAQLRRARRRGARVGDAHARAQRARPARWRQPGTPSPSTTTRRFLNVIVSAASASRDRRAPAAW